MKKLTAIILTAVLAGCASGAPASPSSDDQTVYNIAVVKQLDHASLDEIANAVTGRLGEIAAENNITINYEVYSGQNDQSVLKPIGDQAVSEHVDAIVPIATLAAVTMTACAQDSQTPVIFAAVSDPESADLTGIPYVSGTSDALNTKTITDMMLAQNADIETVGLLYSHSEINSEKPVSEIKEYLDGMNIAYVEATGNTREEVIAAAASLIAYGVDAVFTPTDNVVMDAELSIADMFAEAGIPHYAGADSFVRNGAFATCGVNYTELGRKTADLVFEAVTSGMEGLEDFYLMDGGIVTVNTETAEILDVNYGVFSGFGDVVEVKTTKE